MATSKLTVDQFQDAAGRDPRLSVRPMFGEYAIYFDGAVVGLICHDEVFIKITPGTSGLVPEETAQAPPYPRAKPAYIASDEILDNPLLLVSLLFAAQKDIGPKRDKAKPAAKPRTSRSTGRL